MLVPRIKIKQEIGLERFALWQFENFQFSTQVIGVKQLLFESKNIFVKFKKMTPLQILYGITFISYLFYNNKN